MTKYIVIDTKEVYGHEESTMSGPRLIVESVSTPNDLSFDRPPGKMVSATKIQKSYILSNMGYIDESILESIKNIVLSEEELKTAERNIHNIKILKEEHKREQKALGKLAISNMEVQVKLKAQSEEIEKSISKIKKKKKKDDELRRNEWKVLQNKKDLAFMGEFAKRFNVSIDHLSQGIEYAQNKKCEENEED